MKRFTALCFATVMLLVGCSNSKLMSPSAFTQEFADALRKAGLNVTVVRDLELKVRKGGGAQSTTFLDNAYQEYKHDTAHKDDVFGRFIAATLETIPASAGRIDRSQIVPIIKDRPWIDETREALGTRGVTNFPEHVYESYGESLVVLYAEDSPKNIRYLEPKDLKTADIARNQLRELACANLRRLLPPIEAHGTNGLYMLTAGGNYEASLLLLDSIWTNRNFEVKGEIVVSTPTRDLLLVTGSNDPEGLTKLRKISQDAWAQGTYRLTPKLFVYRNGSFVELP